MKEILKVKDVLIPEMIDLPIVKEAILPEMIEIPETELPKPDYSWCFNIYGSTHNTHLPNTGTANKGIGLSFLGQKKLMKARKQTR